MRFHRCVVVLFGCLGLSSCATQMAVNMAQGNPAGVNRNAPNYNSAPPNPAFYALVPLTIPFDLATLPIQFLLTNSQGGQFTATPVAPPPQAPPQQQGPPPQ
jgi:hypothetical protein